MSGEDMEISTDFGHNGPVDDIDIDLDFAAGRPDEDLELGDFDQTEEFQQFNSDNRDELMAEGDDASYGMVDVDEITYNESATAANDYDIDIGGIGDQAWEESNIATLNDPTASLIGTTDTHADLETTPAGGNPWLHVQPPVEEPELQDAPQKTEESARAAAAAGLFVEEVASLETSITANGVASQDFGMAEQTNQERQIDDAETAEIEHLQKHIDTTQFDELGDFGNEEYAAERGSEVVENGSDALHFAEEHNNDNNPDMGSFHGQEAGLSDDQSQEQQVFAGEDTTSHANQQQSTQDGPQEYADDMGGNEEWTDGAAESDVDEYQPGDDSHDEIGNNHSGQEAVEQDADGALDAPSTKHHGAENDKDDAGPVGDSGADGQAHPENQVTENSTSIANRHEMFVRYGETDYRLFAKSDSDNPDEYFFEDVSVLGLTLTEFMSGIRNVISQEVSPLDELVLHIDGLGLEFAESMTPEFLDKYTFGDILTLYDSLVKNDEPGDIPELYMYLTVRPSCLQRLMALQVQADSGRSLTDVAVYREASPAGQADDTSDEDGVLAVSPEYALEDDLYNEDEEDSIEEQDSQYHAEEDAPEIGLDSAEAVNAPQPAEETTTSHDQHLEVENKESTCVNADDDLVDYDNLDLSPSQQESTDISNDPMASLSGSASTANNATKDVDKASVTNKAQQEDASPQSTSATVTLNGDDNDEIDYDDDDVDANGRLATNSTAPQIPAAKLAVTADDEITWESENEDARIETNTVTSKLSEQVSTTPGKRTRSNSDAIGMADEQKDVKRHRS